MPSTFTTNNGLEKIATGEQSGTWGTSIDALLDQLDDSLDGVSLVTLTTTTAHPLATTSGARSGGCNRVIVFTGAPGGSVSIPITPNTASKLYAIVNRTATALVVSQGSGTTVTVPALQGRLVYADGVGSTASVKDVLALTTDVVTEATALYFTTARARAAFSAAGQGLSYNQSTGAFSSTLSLVQGWTTRVTSFTATLGGGNYITGIGAVTVTLPTGGVDGSVVGFINGYTGAVGFTIIPPAGQTVMLDASLVVDVPRASFTLVLIGNDWRVS